MGIVGSSGDSLELQDRRAKDFFSLTICTATARSWHMMSYSLSLPDQWVGVLSNDDDESLAAMARTRDLALLILGAEAAVNNPNHNDRVEALLQLQMLF